MASETNAGEAVDQSADPRRWRLLGLLGLAQFMLILDVTVVAIAPPHMGADLGLGRDALTWVVSAYTLAIGGRVAQGVGAAMLSPAALSIVVRLFDGEERNRALGIRSALGAGGAAIGVLLGGALTAGPGWEFLINVPVGVVVAILLARQLPPLPAWRGNARLDLVGALFPGRPIPTT